MMKVKTAVFIFLLSPAASIFSQTKSVTDVQQIWLGYLNQTRLTDKFGLWADLHARTKEDFTTNFSQSIVRLGLTYYVNDNTKLTAGYAYVPMYAAEGHTKVTQVEDRLWQQVQWHTKYPKTRMMQWIRLEEKFRQKVLNDSTIGSGRSYSWKVRYNLLYEIPLSQRPDNKFLFVINDELHINFGKQIVYNYFDQNRFFLGFRYNTGKNENIQLGYMNQFVQLAAGNRFRNNHVVRLFYFQNFDFRKKKGGK